MYVFTHTKEKKISIEEKLEQIYVCIYLHLVILFLSVSSLNVISSVKSNLAGKGGGMGAH